MPSPSACASTPRAWHIAMPSGESGIHPISALAPPPCSELDGDRERGIDARPYEPAGYQAVAPPLQRLPLVPGGEEDPHRARADVNALHRLPFSLPSWLGDLAGPED